MRYHACLSRFLSSGLGFFPVVYCESKRTGVATELHSCGIFHTLSLAFRHLPPISARIGYTGHWRGTLYLRAAVNRRCQRPPKGLDTNKTVEATYENIASKHAREHEARPPRVLGDSGGVVDSLDFCPASLKSLGCFYFRCVLSSQWKAVTVNLRILRCQL